MPVRLSDDEAKMINNVSNSLFRDFNAVSGIDVNEKNIILYFLTLKKEGFNSSLLTDSVSTENQIQNFLYSLNPEYKKSYSEIIKFYAPLIKKIDKRELTNMFSRWDALCNSIGTDFLKKYFLEIFDTIRSFYGVFDEGSLIPMELSRLMSNIFPLKKGAKIFNPHAGEANIAFFTSNENVYYGQEPDPFRYIIGKLRLLSCDYPINKFLEYGNIEKEWTPYDLVITDPFSFPTKTSPFYKSKNLLKYSGIALALPLIPVLGVLASVYASSKIINAANASSKEIKENLDFLLKKGIKELNDFGKLVLLVPDSFLYEGISRDNRVVLIDKGLIESVISLPSGILKHTGIKTSLLVINNNKANKGIVNFIDGSNYLSGNSLMNKQLNDCDLIDVIKLKQESSFFRKVTIDAIKKSDYILDFKRYFLESFNGIPLNEFLSLIHGESNSLDEASNFLDIGKRIIHQKLKEDKIDFNLDINTLHDTEVDKSSSQLVESALLVSLHNKNLKPTYFEYVGKPVYLEKGIIPLKVDNNTIVIDYLINELLSDDVKFQVEGLSVGSVLPILSEDDFLKIKITVPSIEQQQLVVDKLKSSILQEKTKELGLEKQLVEFKKDYRSELEVKQHSMRQLLANVTNGMDILIEIMDRNNGVLNASDVIMPEEGILVSHVIENTFLSLKDLKIEVDNLDTKDNFESATSVDLRSLLEETLNNYYNKSANVHIDYKYDHIQFQSENIDEILVMCSEKSLRELLNNIFENAEKHGFRDEKTNYTIDINLFLENGKIVLQILNNGLPFPKGLGKNLGIKGQKAGETGNTGIGVWRIIEIVKHYNFEYKILDEPESDFPVGWIFKFNLIQ